MKFQDIFGHENIKKLLVNSATLNKLSHAYIFEGIRGAGKLSMAKALAALVLCGGDGGNDEDAITDSCGICKTCSMINAGTHPDVRIVTNELYDIQKTSKIISVETIREMKMEVYTKSYMGGKKFFIIPNSEFMNANAQNALLKAFEEPPENVCIILLCENSNALLETIRSRAVLVRFEPQPREIIMEYLSLNSNSDVDKTQINFAADSSNGSIGYAMELLHDDRLIEMQNEICDYFLGIVNSDYTKMYKFILFLKKNNSDINFILPYMSTFLRDMLCVKQRRGEYDSSHGEALCKIYNKISSSSVMRALDIILKYSELILRNINYKTAMHCMVLDIYGSV